jgi:hypothetical protein
MSCILAVLSPTDYFERDNTDQVSVVFINKEITSGNYLIAQRIKHSLTLQAIDTQARLRLCIKKTFFSHFHIYHTEINFLISLLQNKLS